MFNDRLSINAMVCQFVLLTLHSVCTNVCTGAIYSTFVLLNVHAYITLAIERLLRFNEV